MIALLAAIRPEKAAPPAVIEDETKDILAHEVVSDIERLVHRPGHCSGPSGRQLVIADPLAVQTD